MSNQYQAIALSGGGGKGAYQIGVMKAMKELGMLRDLQCISGTSVGALNAVLFAIGDVELAECVWREYVNESTMLKQFDMQSFSISRDLLNKLFRIIGISRLRHCRKVYVYAYNERLKESVPFLLNDKTESQIADLLLASSAIPVIYEPVRINNEPYIDGGVTALGNHPVQVLYSKGYRNILLSVLSDAFNPYSVRAMKDLEPVNLYQKFQDAEIRLLKPRYDIGKFLTGTVDFNTRSIAERIALGYEDTLTEFRQKGRIKFMNTNDEIRQRASASIHSAQDFEEFVALTEWKQTNIITRTWGGHYCYTNIFECDGWKIQQHFKNHYRILDEQDRRRAWTMDPKEIVSALILYGQRKNTNNWR